MSVMAQNGSGNVLNNLPDDEKKRMESYHKIRDFRKQLPKEKNEDGRKRRKVVEPDDKEMPDNREKPKVKAAKAISVDNYGKLSISAYKPLPPKKKATTNSLLDSIRTRGPGIAIVSQPPDPFDKKRSLTREFEGLEEKLGKKSSNIRQLELDKKVLETELHHFERFHRLSSAHFSLPNFYMDGIYVECKDTFFSPVKSIKEPQEYTFYNENRNIQVRMKFRIKNVLRKRREEQKRNESMLQSAYTKQYQEWRNELDMEEEEKEARSLFLSMVEKKRSKRLQNQDAEYYEPKKKTDVSRFEENQCDIPSMDMFSPQFEHEKYLFVDNNRRVLNSLKIEKEAKFYNRWYKEEEEAFKILFARYKKDFKSIASHLPGKSTKEVITFYYLKKYQFKL